WIKDKSLADLDNLPSPDVLAADIIENLQSALESFQELQQQLMKSDKIKPYPKYEEELLNVAEPKAEYKAKKE
ncbi:MAG: hypothetical protein IJF50_02210, partial [Peptococcaceae bacterium]|nr:hypothetical protein [Peptococcaceae bacterium]